MPGRERKNIKWEKLVDNATPMVLVLVELVVLELPVLLVGVGAGGTG